jgi:hypothetical protein
VTGDERILVKRMQFTPLETSRKLRFLICDKLRYWHANLQTFKVRGWSYAITSSIQLFHPEVAIIKKSVALRVSLSVVTKLPALFFQYATPSDKSHVPAKSVGFVPKCAHFLTSSHFHTQLPEVLLLRNLVNDILSSHYLQPCDTCVIYFIVVSCVKRSIRLQCLDMHRPDLQLLQQLCFPVLQLSS